MADEKSAEAVLSRSISTLRINQRYNEGMQLMKERSGEFSSMEECELAGIAMVPDARRYLDDKLQEFWVDTYARSRALAGYPTYGTDSLSGLIFGNQTASEVVIGAGLHAAIYCAGRVSAGFPKPIVIAGDGPVGGTFNMSRGPSFYLNSRNRPGLLGSPLENGSLNVIPGAPIQPSMISFSEFQTNADLAFCIRLTLAKHATVLSGWGNVRGITSSGVAGALALVAESGRTPGSRINALRIIDARGLGVPRDQNIADGKFIMTFPQFMASMDSGFPLRNIRRAAVIGAGDAGKCAVESLLGIGPNASMSTAGLDFVQNIDWYQTRDLPENCQRWRQEIRGRYQRIGSFLGNRLRVLNERGVPTKAGQTVIVNGRTYDKVILCTGNMLRIFDDTGLLDSYRANAGGTPLAVSGFGNRYFRIGPAASIPFAFSEEDISRIPENRAAIFRLANRTAALAATLK